MSFPPNQSSPYVAPHASPTAQGAWGAPDPTAGQTPGPGQAPADGPAPGSDLGADLGAALSFAGLGLLRNPVAYLVSGLIYSVVLGLFLIGGMVVGFIALFGLTEGATSESAELTGVLAFYGILFVVALLAAPLGLLWQTGAARAAGIVLDGGRPSIGEAMIGPVRVLLTALLYGAVTFVGTMLFYLPGLVAGVLFFFAVPAALRGASPMAAMKESLALVRANLATVIVSYLVLMVIASVAGTIIIGILVLTPFLMLFQLGMYERLSGRRLPEPARG